MTVAEIMMALFTAENDTVVEKIENGYIYFGDNTKVNKTNLIHDINFCTLSTIINS